MILRLSQFRAAWLLTAALVVIPAVTPAPAQGTKPPATNTKAAASAVSAQQQSPYNGTVVEDILVRVNDQIISRSDYERADQQLQAEAKQQGIAAADVEARHKDLLRDLIDTQLLLSKGKELEITGETELVRRLDEIRKQNKLDSMEALEKAAADQGVSFEDFKANIRNGIITQSVIRDEVGRRIQLTPSEVQHFYQTHKAEFEQQEQVRLSEILIPTGSSAPQADKSAPVEVDPAKLAEAKATADDVYAKLKAGAKFEELSKTVSSAPTAHEGGDLGAFKRGMLAKELEEKTFPLKVGEITEPIRTKQGYVILKVTEHLQPGADQYKQIQPQVEEAAYMDRMQPALRQYLKSLREQAFVEIKPGFVDTGASPNQTKPVYSAYTPPAVKKKKVSRTRYRQTSFRSKGKSSVAGGNAAGVAPVVATSDGSAPVSTNGASPGVKAGAAATKTAGAGPTSASTAKLPAAPSMRPGKREKVRFGQAPRETLPAAAQTEHEDAGAGSATTVVGDAQQPVGSPAPQGNEIATAATPANPLEPTVDKGEKKRYAARAKLPRVKKPTGPQVDPFAPPPVTTDETATQQTQAAPLGLGGNTAAKPRKVKKTKEEKGDKRRFADKEKPAPANPAEENPTGAAPATLPIPPASTTPAESAPAPATQP